MFSSLKQSEERYRSILENIQDGYFEIDLNGNFTFFNHSICMLFGCSKDEMTGINSRQFTDKNNTEEVLKTYKKVYKTGEPDKGYEWRVIRKDGTRRCIEVSISLLKDSFDQPKGFGSIVRDITERKLEEDKFRKIYMMSPESIAITRLQDGTIVDVNKGFEVTLGWNREDVIGTKSMEQPMNFWVDLRDREQMVKDLRAGRDILHREIAFRRGDGSERAGIYSARTISINDEEHLIFVLQDCTEHQKMSMELQRTLEILRRGFDTTINVMISAVEMRDPYTAGHQRKSSNFAVAIAAEMGLEQEKIDGLRIASIVHDIGKLSVPAEILTKPTRLTPIEFSLLQEHSRCGYEMLKNVESPWPLAEIVYQHHERINGTGYPRNLTGDEILIEARILAVADVVEAMASHRPYRASLGMEKALEEIEKNRGILYDKNVVSACLRLIREKSYRLM